MHAQVLCHLIAHTTVQRSKHKTNRSTLSSCCVVPNTQCDSKQRCVSVRGLLRVKWEEKLHAAGNLDQNHTSKPKLYSLLRLSRSSQLFPGRGQGHRRPTSASLPTGQAHELGLGDMEKVCHPIPPEE